jgi:hypothetical protein
MTDTLTPVAPTPASTPTDPYEALDEMFGTDPLGEATAPMDVTIFVPETEGLPAGLYIDGTLHLIGPTEDAYRTALKAFGARVVSDDSHTLGHGPTVTQAQAAPDLQTVVSYITAADQVAALEAQAAEIQERIRALQSQMPGRAAG